LLPGAKNIVDTVVLGFRGTKNNGLYDVFCSESLKKCENTNYLTIFGHYETERKAAGATTTTTTTTTVPWFLISEAPNFAAFFVPKAF